MHQLFVTTPPTYGEGLGDSWAKVPGNFFLMSGSAGECRGFDIMILIPGRLSIVKDRAKSIVLAFSLSPGAGAYSRALKTKMLLSPPFPILRWEGSDYK